MEQAWPQQAVLLFRIIYCDDKAFWSSGGYVLWGYVCKNNL